MFVNAYIMQMRFCIRAIAFGQAYEQRRTHHREWHKNENTQPKRILHTRSEFGLAFFYYYYFQCVEWVSVSWLSTTGHMSWTTMHMCVQAAITDVAHCTHTYSFARIRICPHRCFTHMCYAYCVYALVSFSILFTIDNKWPSLHTCIYSVFFSFNFSICLPFMKTKTMFTLLPNVLFMPALLNDLAKYVDLLFFFCNKSVLRWIIHKFWYK